MRTQAHGLARARRAAVAAVLVVAVLSTVVATQAAVAQLDLSVPVGTYRHEWQAQAMAGGAGEPSQQRVLSSVAEVAYGDGKYEGTIDYHDVLGVGAAPNTVSQEAEIELALSGSAVSGASVIGGTFTGTVTLSMRTAADAASAVSDETLATEAVVTTYEVAGHWGAEIAGDVARGELVYENAVVRDGADGPADGPAYFNRAATSAADELGGAQYFAAQVSDLAPVGPTGPDDEDGADGDGQPEPGRGDSGGRTGVLGYIRKGLSGGELGVALPIPAELAAAARALYESRPVGATELPANAVAIDVHVAGAHLDAKNRAAGLLAEEGPTVPGADDAAAAAESMRGAVPGVAAASSAAAWRDLATGALGPLAGTPGVDGVAAQLGHLDAAATGAVDVYRTWYHVASAAGSQDAYGSVMRDAADIAAAVGETPFRGGPLADAVLVAADSPSAPSSMLAVARFEREESRDASASAHGESLPAAALATSGVDSGGTLGLQYASAEGFAVEAPARWLAYRRADGARFWLAGEGGERALTEASLLGWAHSTYRAALVDATRCGRWLAVYPTR